MTTQNNTIPFAIILLLSLGALATGYIAEYAYDIKPCVLCWYQRYAYMTAAGAAALALLPVFKAYALQLFGLCTFSYFTNFALAVFQVLVEKKVIAAPAICKGVEVQTLGKSFADFEAALKQAGSHVPCDQVAFELFGISMAGYNALFTLVIFLGLGTYFGLLLLKKGLKS